MKKLLFKILLSFTIFFLHCFNVNAQVGEYRNSLAVGVNGGVSMSSVGFTPKVTQGLLIGTTFGLSARYTSERYFSTICSVAAELNLSQMGWNENIVDLHTNPVIGSNNEAEQYKRKLQYIQLPVLAHLAWGQEMNGVQFYFEVGPQFGYMIGESTITNFTSTTANLDDRANTTHAQYDMPVENKLDYGICAGMGIELAHSRLGHFLLGGRYYYGLGNIYGATKSDYFAKSNQSAIQIKLAYLFDLTTTAKSILNKQK